MAKGGGSANKSMVFQETKALLNPASLAAFLDAKLRSLGTAACPPYHLAIVIGGTSAEYALKTAKLASARTSTSCRRRATRSAGRFATSSGSARCSRSRAAPASARSSAASTSAIDARVIRLPRHGASCPVAIAVSCSADRQALGKITRDGVFLEQLEQDPARYLPTPRTMTSRRRGQDRPDAADGRDPPGAVALSIKTRLVLSGR